MHYMKVGCKGVTAECMFADFAFASEDNVQVDRMVCY